MRGLFKTGAAIILTAWLAASSAAAANIVKNPGFEADGGFTNITITDWEVDGWYGTFRDGRILPFAGGHFAATGCSNQFCKLSQTLTTVPGEFYDLSFEFNPGVGAFDTALTNILWDGFIVYSVGQGPLDWVHHTVFELQATRTQTVLTFIGFQGTANNGLDEVSVVSEGLLGEAGVPEPASWALMLAGFAGVGAAIRGRRRARIKSAAQSAMR